MKTPAILTILALLPLSVAAQVPGNCTHEFYRRPVTWLPSDTLCDRLPDAYASLDAHLRVRVPAHHRLDVSLIYNRSDSLNYSRVRLYREPGPVDDRIVAAPVSLSVCAFRNGVKYDLGNTRISRGLNPQSDDFSLKLHFEHGGAVLMIGQDGEVHRQSIAFNSTVSDELLWVCGSPAAVVRHTLSAEAVEPIRYSRFGGTDSLAEYLKASTDPNEGYWTYFDRDTDALRFNIPGNYRLATVRRHDGAGYEIIYLGGAPEASGQWRPMRVKGYLKPTGFIGHFDLEWIDLEGRIHRRETSADITDGSSLTLYFPLYGGKVRFRKILQTD